MNKKSILFKSIALISAIVLNATLCSSLNKNAQVVDAYSTTSLPSEINLNDCSEQTIRSYYFSLNSKDASERQGTNLLKNLKPILKNGQKYLSYDSNNGNDIWDAYCIVDRDWKQSPASSLPAAAGTYNSETNKITNYHWGNNSATYENPYVHALYYNRDKVPIARAYGDHQNNTSTGMNREHIWPKGAGFDTKTTSQGGTGGARGDLLHLWAAHAYTNGIHSNNFYGYVDTSKTHTDIGDSYSMCAGNLSGRSKTFPSSSNTVFEPQDSDKGDIARACFYMAARYNYLSGSDSDGIDSNNPNLELVNNVTDFQNNGYESTTTNTGKLGILQDLLEWNRLDPPDQFEIHRNNLCYNNFTGNRNPFIDFPSWADAIWGTSEDGNYNSIPTKIASPASDPINNFAVSFSISSNELELEVGETAEISGNNATSNIAWSIDDNTVASLDKNSTANNEAVTVTALKAGTTTITATSGGSSATCSVTVTEPIVINYGTLENPLTVDEAINVIGTTQNVETAQPLYVKGVVTSNSAYNTKFSNYDYAWLQNEDGSEAQAFELYRFKLSGVDGDYASANSMVGKEVVAYGYGKFYNGETYELSTSSNNPKNPLVYSITEQAVSSVDDYFDNASRYFELLGNEGTGLEETTDFVTFSTAGLDNAENIVDFSIGDVTLTSDVGNNTSGNRPKYYNTGTSMRVYWGNTFTFTCDENIKEINFTFSQGNSDSLSASVGVIDENTWTGNTKSVTFTNIDTSGQIRFSGISVTYEQEVLAVSNVAMRFGMSISKNDWNNIHDEWGIDDFGVMMVKETTLEGYGVSSVKAAFKAGKTLKISRKGTYSEPYSIDEDNYLFTVKMNMTTVDSYNVVYCAAPFIVVDDEYYFLDDVRYSVNLMATYYLNHDGCNLSDEALTLLSTLH